MLACIGFMFILLLPCPELSATPPATLKFGAAYAIPTARPDVYAHPAAGLPVALNQLLHHKCLRHAPSDRSTRRAQIVLEVLQ